MSVSLFSQTGWEKLTDGVDVLLRPDDTNDIVAFLMFLPTGSAVESAADSGVMALTARMLMRGTKQRGNAELAEMVDSLGISISCDVNDDYSNMHFVTTKDTLRESVELLAEILFTPAFEPEELEKERQSTLAGIRRNEDDLFSFALQRFYQELYPDHGYGLPNIGLKESIGELTREQVSNSYEELVGGPFRIVAVGNFVAEDLKGLIRDFILPHVGTRDESERLVVRAPRPSPAHGVQITRESEQAYLVAGFPALSPTDPDYLAARVLNALLGEGMSSRLFSALREEKGLAYATGSSYSAYKMQGQLFGYIGTKPESLGTAREGMIAEFERIKTELVPEDELRRAKNYMMGKFLIDHQTNYRRAFYLGHFDQMGLGWDMDDRYADLISKVTAEQVQAVARKVLTEPVIVELIPS